MAAPTSAEHDTALLDALRDEFSRRSPELAAQVLEALLEHAEQDDDLDEAIWGPAPPIEEVIAAEIRTQERLQQARGQVLADSLSRAEAADRLGVGPQRVSALVDAGELIALEDGGQLRLPAWQFHSDTPRGRLEGLGEVVGAYAGGPVTLTQWMTRPNPALDGRTPVTALLEGDREQVAAAARAHA